MGNVVRLYRLDFAPSASASERAEMCTLLEVSAMVSCTYSSQRSGPFGLERSMEISYAEITTMSDWEDSYIHKVIGDNPLFAKSTLTQIK